MVILLKALLASLLVLVLGLTIGDQSTRDSIVGALVVFACAAVVLRLDTRHRA